MHTHLFHHVCFCLRLHTHTLRSFNECKRNYLNKLCTSFTWSFRFISLHMRLNERRQWNNLIKKLWAYTTLSSWISFGSKWKQKKLKEWNRLKQSQFKDFVLVILSWKFIPSIFVLYFHRFCHSTSTHKKKLWNLFWRQCTHSMA